MLKALYCYFNFSSSYNSEKKPKIIHCLGNQHLKTELLLNYILTNVLNSAFSLPKKLNSRKV